MMTDTIQHNAYSFLAEKFSLQVDAPLKGYTSFKVGGPADLLALPESKNELEQLLNEASALDIPITLFGGGTNLLVTDKGIRGLVVITKKLKNHIKITDHDPNYVLINALSGQRLSAVCRFAVENSLSGLEFAAGIPGTLGGAICMNAGTPSGQMSDIVDSIEIWHPQTGGSCLIKKDLLNFSYRNFEVPGMISGANLKLKKGNRENIESIFKQNIEHKKNTQPVSHASAGCFFKNPAKGKPAGELIEKAGLKGTRLNDAMVSEHHANYIVNLKNATCKDILLLKQEIQDAVFKKFHINLETEVRIEGE